MKIGIFLGYKPGTAMKSEGLGRYLGKLIQNLQQSGNKIVIACPEWLLPTLTSLFEDFDVETEDIRFIIGNKIPVVWKLYVLHSAKKEKKKWRNWNKGIKSILTLLLDLLLSVTNIVMLMGLLLIALLLVIAFSPLAIIFVILHGIYLIGCRAKNKGENIFSAYVNRISLLYTRLNTTGINIYEYLSNSLAERMQEQLVKKINKKKDVADVWYSPAVFWPPFNRINAPKIINVPDLVTIEFATKWGDDKSILYSAKKCAQTIEEGEYFVTYCNYVKETLLIQRFGKDEKKIFVIPHGVNNLKQYIFFDSNIVNKIGMGDAFTTSFCKNVIFEQKKHVVGIDDYISGFKFDDVDFIFYPSQARPYKNLMNLVKAYEYLLRKKYIRVKLILTCDLNAAPDVKDYVIQHRLQYDVICFHNVDIKGLAALYFMARLVVNPTLYEGGFPFTFGEGMSVGTPSIMGKIPQVLEMTESFDLEDILFDPYDMKSIADRIEYGLQNRDMIYQKELKMYQWISQEFNSKKAGELYVQAFKNACE